MSYFADSDMGGFECAETGGPLTTSPVSKPVQLRNTRSWPLMEEVRPGGGGKDEFDEGGLDVNGGSMCGLA